MKKKDVIKAVEDLELTIYDSLKIDEVNEKLRQEVLELTTNLKEVISAIQEKSLDDGIIRAKIDCLNYSIKRRFAATPAAIDRLRSIEVDIRKSLGIEAKPVTSQKDALVTASKEPMRTSRANDSDDALRAVTAESPMRSAVIKPENETKLRSRGSKEVAGTNKGAQLDSEFFNNYNSAMETSVSPNAAGVVSQGTKLSEHNAQALQGLVEEESISLAGLFETPQSEFQQMITPEETAELEEGRSRAA